MKYKIKDKETGKIHYWTESEVLDEINRDRDTDEWEDVSNTDDVLECFKALVESEGYYNIYDER